MKEVIEEWRDIAGYKGKYQVSSLGRVRSLDRIVKKGNGYGLHRLKGVILKPVNHNGYLHVCICKSGEIKHARVHRLVAQAFLTNPDNLPEVNHIDENKQNNAVTNLEWCDRLYNTRYGTGIARRTESQKNRVDQSKCVQQLTLEGQIIKEYPSAKEASRQTGLTQGGISNCCRGGYYDKNRGKWHTVSSYNGYKWQYA